MSSKARKQRRQGIRQAVKQRKGRTVPPESGWERLVLVIAFLKQRMFAHLKLHGNSKWEPLTLVLLAVLWSWGSSEQTLEDRYHAAAGLVRSWNVRTFVFSTYQGFIGALTTWSGELVLAIAVALQQNIQKSRYWQTSRRPLFAIDGTKVGVPWTASTDRELGQQTLNRNKKKTKKQKNKARKKAQARQRSANSLAHQAVRPQALLTLAWHVGTGLPWSWRTGPVSASEREHARELVKTMPAGSVILGDAGFTGYEFWLEILQAGHNFVIRIGSNVKLLKKLGWKVRNRGNFACLWPDDKRKQGQPPVVVRLVKFQTARTTVWLATSISDPKELSDAELAEMYRQRWGIEGWFRALKQTFGRRTLRSHEAEHVLCELDWSIVGLALIQHHGVQALEAAGQSPHDLSEAEAIRVIRSTIMHADFGLDQLPTLKKRLRRAVLDTYTRTAPKEGRYIHRKKTTKPPGEPHLIDATPEQRRAARQLQAAKGAA